MARRIDLRTVRSFFFSLSLGATALAFTPGAKEAPPPDLVERFRAQIAFLADDRLEGRGVGSKGLDVAADYIADRFKEIGLEPAGDGGTYFQSFPMTLQRTQTDRSRFVFVDREPVPALHKDFEPYSFSSDDAFTGDVVFCGYGIIAPDRQRDDFAGADVTGKVALMFVGEPPSWADENGFPSKHAMLRNKVYNAKDRGAVAAIFVNTKPPVDGADRLPEFSTDDPDEYGLPAFHLARSIADERIKAGGLGSLDELQTKLDGGAVASGWVAHLQASGQMAFEKRTAQARNVLGLLRGEGPLAEEWVVIGAHYDHLGLRRPMARTFKEGQLVAAPTEPAIHNGADDNASGVSGVIEIARMFKADTAKPRRSILFVAFSGEEAGLHGSKFYTQTPREPLDKTVAMLNLDMVGRLDPTKNKVEVFGVATAAEFASILDRAAVPLGLSIASGVDEGGRSDHAPFVRKQIPALHFFSGQHSDYHKPTDDTDKINAEGGARIAMLIHRTAREIADYDSRFAFIAPKKPAEGERGPAPSYKVVMGLAPSYSDDGKPGMGVDAVNSDGPADLAGMKAGDRIIRIADKKIANIYDYMAATRNNKPGDEVEVVVVRDDKEITLKVKLAGAR